MLRRLSMIALTLSVGAISNYAQSLDSLSYSAGMLIGGQIRQQVLPAMGKSFEGTPQHIDVDVFLEGLRAAVKQESGKMQQAAAEQYFQKTESAARTKAETAYREQNEQWLRNNLKQPGVKTTATGLQYKVIKEGNGPKPSDKDKVTVRYEGKFIDGTEFDSSYKRTPDTTTFPVSGVIKGWTEALQLMPVGSIWELYIPQQLGYGTRQTGPIKAYSTLIFKIELLAIAQ